ncbi:MAG TPA: PQQ-binding-like beta-propeller repeat protein [Steroidobacteraceae bacterium]|nr:PQQ-binding-like beta-propeller repeat protein [Steroidobacteraceae bacterium]
MPKKMSCAAAAAAVMLAFVAAVPVSRAASGPDGAALYAQRCAKCHDHGAGHVPSREALANRPASNIVMALLTGAMRPQASGLSRADAGAIAAFVTAGAAASAPRLHPNPCREPLAPLETNGRGWNGWSADLANTRFQPHPGLAAQNVSRLKLKWAFTFPGAMTWGQPTVVGGRVFVASTTGEVYALDAESGCTVWSLHVGTPVRTAISIGPAARAPGAAAASGERSGASGRRAVAYFGDLAGVVYAVDADTGVELWHARVEKHPNARITGAPVLFGSRLLVPVSSFEEGPAADPAYACCTFRGSVVALDAASGRLLWKHHTIAQPPRPYRRKGDPTVLEGPAGGAVWNAPTIDRLHGVLYVGTGNDYTDVDAPTTDAVLAIGVADGRTRWARQLTAHDDWASGCTLGGACPVHSGEDADFAASTILVSLPSGRRVLVAGQKSGLVYGLDPDAAGRVLWKRRVGAGGVFGGIEWGMAAIGGTVYVPISDSMPTRATDTPRPGLGAIDAATGKLLWWAPAPSPTCAWGADDCRAALSQAITTIPGIVFAGSQDGHLRAYDARDGKVVWDFDTARQVPAVNAESAHGGSLDAGGPVVADGMVFVNSGYGQFLGRGGNALLAFGTDH